MPALSRFDGRRAVLAVALATGLAAQPGCDRLDLPDARSVATHRPTAVARRSPSMKPTSRICGARMARGELDSRTLTQAYLDRIAEIDDAGPDTQRRDRAQSRCA